MRAPVLAFWRRADQGRRYRTKKVSLNHDPVSEPGAGVIGNRDFGQKRHVAVASRLALFRKQIVLGFHDKDAIFLPLSSVLSSSVSQVTPHTGRAAHCSSGDTAENDGVCSVTPQQGVVVCMLFSASPLVSVRFCLVPSASSPSIAMRGDLGSTISASSAEHASQHDTEALQWT